jgi:uncharacterized membrane protein
MDKITDQNALSALDRIAKPVQRATKRALDAVPPLRDALGGKWIGHPLHPVVNDIPIGAFTSGLVLDMIEVFGGTKKLRRGADAVQIVGLASAGVAAVTGLAEFTRLEEGRALRIGFIHGAANMIIAGLTGGSLVARAAGLRKVGIALSGAGFGLMLVSGGLGALVAYKLGAVTQAQKAIEGEAPKAKPEAGRAEETGEGGARRAPQRPAKDGAFVRS